MLSLTTGDYDWGEFGGGSTAAQMVRTLRRNFPVTTAGDHGSLTAWWDGGGWVGEFHQWMCLKASCRVKSKAELKAFLKEHWPIMTDGCAGL